MNRYFLLMYTGTNGTGYFVGQSTYVTTGGFLNKKKAMDYLASINSGNHNIVINNIIELSSSDYEDWCA